MAYQKSQDWQKNFCLKCGRDTFHVLVPNPFFPIGLMCVTCKTFWDY